MKQNIIAVDFDGTLCENKWPEIGMPNEGGYFALCIERKLHYGLRRRRYGSG